MLGHKGRKIAAPNTGYLEIAIADCNLICLQWLPTSHTSLPENTSFMIASHPFFYPMATYTYKI